MLLKIFFRLVFCVFITALAAKAAPVEPLQSEIYYDVQYADGEPKICSVQFSLLYKDYTYKNGQTVFTTGSVNWLKANRGLGMFLKVSVADLTNFQPPTMEAVNVNAAYIVIGTKSHKPVKRIECEETTAFCGVYGFENTPSFLEALQSKSFFVNYNRHKQALDVQLLIKPRLVPAEIDNFYECLEQLLKAVN